MLDRYEPKPFPLNVQGDVFGAFYCRELPEKRFQYVEIYPKPFMRERDAQLIADGVFTIEELFPHVKRLGRIPPEGTLWTYDVQSFEVAYPHNLNSIEIADYATNYHSEVFDTLEDALTYCENTFSMSRAEFKNKNNSHYS